MPDAMPRPISKGKLLNRVDDFLNADFSSTSPNRAALKTALEDLGKSVLEAADDANMNIPVSIERHLERHWFGDDDEGGEWWEELQPIANIVRYGMLDALRRGVGLPIYTYWICGPATFEVVSTVTTQQLTFLFLTPMPPAMGPLVTYHASDVESIFETTADIGVTQVAPTSGAPDPREEGVVTLQQRKEE